MKTKYCCYQFEDGYWCCTVGKLSKVELSHEIQKHGKMIKMEVKFYE